MARLAADALRGGERDRGLELGLVRARQLLLARAHLRGVAGRSRESGATEPGLAR